MCELELGNHPNQFYINYTLEFGQPYKKSKVVILFVLQVK
jgi:hypothetical protein